MKRGIDKKAVSPLIAVVLTIGFTVALAVIVTNWGQGLFKDIQEQTGEKTTTQLTCISDVGFDIKDVCISGSNIKVRIVNMKQKDIDSFIMTLYQNDITTEQATANMTTNGNGIVSLNDEWSEEIAVTGSIKKIEARPTITIKGKQIICTEHIESFGDEYGDAITKTCS